MGEMASRERAADPTTIFKLRGGRLVTRSPFLKTKMAV